MAAYKRFAESLSTLITNGVADSLVELALRFSAHSPKVSVVIPGAKSVAQLEQNLKAIDKGPLPESALAEMDRLRHLHLAEIVPPKTISK